MNRNILLGLLVVLCSCNSGTQKTSSTATRSETEVLTEATVETNRFEQDWENFKAAVVGNTAFDWNLFVEIEGQFGEDYAYLFQEGYVIEALKTTTYKDLYDKEYEGQKVKQFTAGLFEDPQAPMAYAYYFKETDRGLRFVGWGDPTSPDYSHGH